jgi:hypothetical protein
MVLEGSGLFSGSQAVDIRYESMINVLRDGALVGKSEVISEKAVRFALKNPGTITMIIAASQRQSSLLFEI